MSDSCDDANNNVKLMLPALEKEKWKGINEKAKGMKEDIQIYVCLIKHTLMFDSLSSFVLLWL